MFVTGLWIKANMLQNHCDFHYSVARVVPVRSLWIKARMLQNHSDLRYSVALVYLSEAFRSKQKCCKTIVVFSILLPGDVCQRPVDQSKNVIKTL